MRGDLNTGHSNSDLRMCSTKRKFFAAGANIMGKMTSMRKTWR